MGRDPPNSRSSGVRDPNSADAAQQHMNNQGPGRLDSQDHVDAERSEHDGSVSTQGIEEIDMLADDEPGVDSVLEDVAELYHRHKETDIVSVDPIEETIESYVQSAEFFQDVVAERAGAMAEIYANAVMAAVPVEDQIVYEQVCDAIDQAAEVSVEQNPLAGHYDQIVNQAMDAVAKEPGTDQNPLAVFMTAADEPWADYNQLGEMAGYDGDVDALFGQFYDAMLVDENDELTDLGETLYETTQTVQEQLY